MRPDTIELILLNMRPIRATRNMQCFRHITTCVKLEDIVDTSAALASKLQQSELLSAPQVRFQISACARASNLNLHQPCMHATPLNFGAT